MAQAKHDSITRRALLSGAGALVPAAAMAGVPASAPDVASAFASRLRPKAGFGVQEATADGPAPSGLPSEPDPIFAAIEGHERACVELEAHIPVLAAAEQAAWHAPRGQRRAANARLKQEYAAQGRFCDLLGEATERFVATVPHTLQGAAAALAYVRMHDAKGYPVCEEEECFALLASIEAAICRAAGLPASGAAAKPTRRA
jgi:hypothetical protein